MKAEIEKGDNEQVSRGYNIVADEGGRTVKTPLTIYTHTYRFFQTYEHTYLKKTTHTYTKNTLKACDVTLFN